MQEDRLQKQKLFYRGFFLGKQMYHSMSALELAIEHHSGSRKDGRPEVSHQFEIVNFLNQILGSRIPVEDLDAIIASAFLHDLIEDYPEAYSFEDLMSQFGERIHYIVGAVTKNADFDKNNPTHMEHYFAGILDIPEAVIVKGVDRIHNLQTMYEGLSQARQLGYITEVETYFYPLLKKARKMYPQYYLIYINLAQTMERQLYFLKHLHSAASRGSQ